MKCKCIILDYTKPIENKLSYMKTIKLTLKRGKPSTITGRALSPSMPQMINATKFVKIALKLLQSPKFSSHMYILRN